MSAETVEFCAECGHAKRLHYGFTTTTVGFGLYDCQATIDRRPLAVGGDTLTPCHCKRFVGAVPE